MDEKTTNQTGMKERERQKEVFIAITQDDKGYLLFVLAENSDCWTITQEELNKLGRSCDMYRTDKPYSYEIPKL